MVKPLSFKGEKKPKKRKRPDESNDGEKEATDENATTASKDDDVWVSPAEAGELMGPSLITLPTLPPTCLASDVDGNVFASPLENMIEDDPRTAEPHNVQQVWVASRLSGMKEDEISFKAAHGGYLSCDQYGILGARREARGFEENFVIESAIDEVGRIFWQLRTAASKADELRYVSATTEGGSELGEQDGRRSTKKVSISLRGDGEVESPCTYIMLRMQARFKPQTYETKQTSKMKDRVSRQELEAAAGRKLNDEEARKLKRAKRKGGYQEAILDIRAKGKHDKYA